MTLPRIAKRSARLRCLALKRIGAAIRYGATWVGVEREPDQPTLGHREPARIPRNYGNSSLEPPARRDMELHVLPALEELRVAAVLVHLLVEQVRVSAEERGGDHSRGLLVLGHEPRGSRREGVRIGDRDPAQRAAADVVHPDAAAIGLVAHVLLDDHLTAVVDRDVVHHLRARRARAL